MDYAKQQQWRQCLKELGDLQITNHRLTTKNVEGGAGPVKLAIMDEDSETREPQQTSVKELRPIGSRNDRERMAFRLLRELRIWAKLKHPNIIALSGYYLDETTFETVCLYSPYCERGSLPVFIKSGNLSEACRLQLALDTALGLEYLHNHKPSICHSDIKGDNVLINDRMHAILCGLEPSRILDDSKKYSSLTTQLVRGSERYASPELLDDDESKYTLESDVWAWGCLLLEIMSGQIPFARVPNQLSIMVKIVAGEKPAAPEDVSANAEVHSLAAKCWARDPKSRPRLTRCAEVLKEALEDQSALTMTVLLYNSLEPTIFGKIRISGARTAADVWRAVIDELYITPPNQPSYYLRLPQQSDSSRPLMGAELLSYFSERVNRQESPTIRVKCLEGRADVHDVNRKVFILAALQTTAADDIDEVVDRISDAVAEFDTEVTSQWLRFATREIWKKCQDDSELVTSRAMARLCKKLGNELKGNVKYREKGNNLPSTAGPAFRAQIVNHSYNRFKASFPAQSNTDHLEAPVNTQNGRPSPLSQPSGIRAVNAVRFIACLYQEDLLPWGDVRHYLDSLTEGALDHDGLKIQCLCTLLMVVGQHMETKEKHAVNHTFDIISRALFVVPKDGSKIDVESREALEALVKYRQAKWRNAPATAAHTTQVSSALGLNGMPFGPSSKANPFATGQLGSLGRMTSDERFAASSPRIASTGSSFVPGRPTPMSRSSSQGGVGGVGAGGVPPSPREANLTQSQRGRQRNDSLKPTPAPPPQQHQMQNGFGFEPVVALQQTDGRWKPPVGRNKQQLDESSPEYVERKVKALLNKLTFEKFDSISNQIIEWANKSEKETNGQTLIHVIKLVFEKATDEATFSEMYARLCRKMMETISPYVQDESIRNNEGKPIVGGHLFRKYLINRCQKDFERGWSTKESTQAAAEAASMTDDGEVALYSDEYYAAFKARRQGLGLVKFIGEVFKLQMLTERVIHECIKKLSKIDNPEEEDIESLCQLLSTVGQSLDTQKVKGRMDIYFASMKTLADHPNIGSRVRRILLDVIELRERRWQVHQAVAAPQTIAQVHEQAAKERAVGGDATQNCRIGMSRGGSQRREQGPGEYGQPGADGWNVAGPTPMRAPVKAGDLSNFGKFTEAGPMMSMGPSNFFKKGDHGRDTPPAGGNFPLSAPSSSTMFSLLDSSEARAEGLPQWIHRNRGISRKAGVDLNNAAPQIPTTPKKFQLLPRTDSLTTTDEQIPYDEHSETGTETADAAPSMTDQQAKKKVEQDIKEFFAIRNLDEAEAYFDVLPEEHKSKLVDKLVGKALEAKEEDSELVADLFSRAAGKSCSNAAFVDGFSGSIEFLDDIAIDAPYAYPNMARMLRGSKLPQDAVESLAAKIYVDGDPVNHPRDKFLKLYAEML